MQIVSFHKSANVLSVLSNEAREELIYFSLKHHGTITARVPLDQNEKKQNKKQKKKSTTLITYTPSNPPPADPRHARPPIASSVYSPYKVETAAAPLHYSVPVEVS